MDAALQVLQVMTVFPQTHLLVATSNLNPGPEPDVNVAARCGIVMNLLASKSSLGRDFGYLVCLTVPERFCLLCLCLCVVFLLCPTAWHPTGWACLDVLSCACFLSVSRQGIDMTGLPSIAGAVLPLCYLAKAF